MGPPALAIVAAPGPAELDALARKYRQLVELRRAGAPHQHGDERARLRALASEFPGALRELDTLPTDELERRAETLEAAARGGTVEPWMVWTHQLHALTRAALAVKAALARGPLDEATRAAVATRTGVTLDDAFVAAVAAPPHGRVLAAVFDRLAQLHGVERQTLWDALIPPRRGTRGYRR